MIPFLDLTRQHTALQPELMDAVARVLASSRFVLGPEGQALETELDALNASLPNPPDHIAIANGN